MLAAGATDGNGQIAAIRLRELADALLQKCGQIRNHAAHARVAREVFDHGRIAAVQIAQRGFPIGFGRLRTSNTKSASPGMPCL